MKKRAALVLMLLCLCAAAFALAEPGVGIKTFGKLEVPGTVTYVDLGDTAVKDWNAFYAFLDELPNLKKVDMFTTKIKPKQIDALVERYLGIEFGWTMQIAEHLIRTDCTAFSTLHYSGAKTHSAKELGYVRYCKNLKALDLGHNGVDDLSFLYELPELRVLIMACNRVTDITPIGSLTKLEYLELFSNRISDISPLTNCTHLMDLNIGFNEIADLTPLCQLTNLKRLWMYNCVWRNTRRPIPEDQLAALKAALPDCQMDIKSNPSEGGWRVHPHFDIIHNMFRTTVYEPFADSFPEEEPTTLTDLVPAA